MSGDGLLTYNVNRASFSVPSDLKVLSAEGYGAFGDSIRTVKKVTFIKPAPAVPSTPVVAGGQQKHHHQSNSPTPAAVAMNGPGVVVEEERYFIIRKFAGVVTNTHPQDLKRVVRLCQLHLALGSSVPGLLPLANAYRDEQSPGDVYCIYPALACTLAEVVYSRTPLALGQGVAIIRELCRALEKLHSCGLVLGDLRPDWVRIDPQLRTVGSVSIANTTYAHFPSEGVEAVFGGADPAPGDKPLLWYRAPELVLDGVAQLTPAADMWTLGCIMAELFLRRPLFEASTLSDYITGVTNALGLPDDATKFYNSHAIQLLSEVPEKHSLSIAHILPGVPLEIQVLVQRLLCWNPANRMSAKELLRMPLLTPLAPVVTATAASGGGVRTTTTAQQQQQQQQQAAAAAGQAVNQQQGGATDVGKAAPAALTPQQMQQEALDNLKAQWMAANNATVQDVVSVLRKQLDECVSFY